MTTWREHLTAHAPSLFDEAFLARWGQETWAPSCRDRKAAAKLHTQLVSRITTQRLDYHEGVEVTALTSVYQLFDQTRTIADEAGIKAKHFDAIAWHVLNRHVRPFTAKWHRQSERGALDALDASDIFRAELQRLQPLLVAFDALLVGMRDNEPPRRPDDVPDGGDAIRAEMAASFAWEIPGSTNEAAAINTAESAAIAARRANYTVETPAGQDAVGLALSGGGIRSATFSLGVMAALARRNILPQIDYLSTVSGGGYLGAFLAAYLTEPQPAGETPARGLRASELPFHRTMTEPEPLRAVRHRCRYLLTGSAWGRARIAFAQVYGVLLNVVGLTMLIGGLAAVEFLLRRQLLDCWGLVTTIVALVTAAIAIGLPLGRHLCPWVNRHADGVVAVPAALLLGLVIYGGLGWLHAQLGSGGPPTVLIVASAIPLALAPPVLAIGRALDRVKVVALALATVAIVTFALVVELLIYDALDNDRTRAVQCLIAVAVGMLVTYRFVDVNVTGLHRHYRDQLAGTFLPGAPGMRLSGLGGAKAPYPLINAALNVPDSKNTTVQGRLTDFFLFSPHYCGSPTSTYRPTADWEAADPTLTLATAMAVSGAAASPQMGQRTSATLRFLMALFNVRLGYWIRKPPPDPASGTSASGLVGRLGGLWRRIRPSTPDFVYLLREMFGLIDETHAFLNLSDGGHIENLGVYELLRRRCKFIVAVDGEQDPRMTFHAITNLQRIASIDLGVEIEIDLNDLRLNAKGFTRSHFIFARIDYPGGDIGYLLYLKLSLTGNEKEFLRRYKLDEPNFPHHSTADQFFTEAQFEAYRALGEHVGDKLFLEAIVGPESALRKDPGDSKDDVVLVRKWFTALGVSLLQPRP